MKLIDADALKICMQDHYGVIEQDCSISEEFADGAISGIDAAIFEVDAAPNIDAIPVEWLGQKIRHEGERGNILKVEYIKELIWEWHQEEEE